MPDLPVFVLMFLQFLILTSVTVSAYLGAICHHFISLGRQSPIRNYLNSTYHIIIIMIVVLQVAMLTTVSQ